ncbi:MAG: tonB dependent receptor family protein [Herbaspirillum sp.]|nr:tonB dependent receptor family protein [Herbaspirillum sp.]
MQAMHIRKKQTALAVSTALICMHAAMADDDVQMAPVTVVGHYDNAVGSSDAASQGVVRGSTLKDLPLLRPGEILETVPGLVVTQHSGDGKANQYFLRGYNLDHGTDFATTVNGVPANMPTNAHGQGYSDLNFVMPELVDRIDYRKGPYFAGNGDFSSAGSADILYVKKLDQSIVNLTVGAEGYRREVAAGSITLGAPVQQSAKGAGSALIDQGPTLLGALELEHNDGPWAVKEGFKKTNAFARLSDGGSTNGWSIDATYYDAQWNSTDQVPLALIQSGQLCRYCAMDPTDGGNSTRAIVSGEWHSHDADGYTKVAAFAEHEQMALWSDFTFFELRPATGDQFQQAESRNIFGAQFVKGWNHTLFGHDSVTEAGLQLRHDNIDVSLDNSQARVPYQTVTNDQVGETMSSLYLQNTTSWNDWFRTLAGVRGDAVAMNMTSYSLPQNSGAAAGKKLSPKLSLIFGPWAKTEFFMNAGKGFHSNDARGVIDKIDPTTGDAATAVPSLAGSVGKEIGLRSEWVDGLQSSLALWSLNSDSEIVYAADSAIGSTSPNGASKRYGIEWNNHWIANRWLLIDADMAWTHARYATPGANNSAGDFIPNAAGRVGLFRATLHDLGPWTVGLETRYIGPYPLAQDGSLIAPSAMVTNLRLQRELTRNVSVAVDALNLFNRQYYDIAYEQDYQVSPASPVTPNGVTVHPGEPRAIRVTLALKF